MNTSFLSQIQDGDAEAAMEAAKALIVQDLSMQKAHRYVSELALVAANRHNSEHSRIAAIYALGFLVAGPQVGTMLKQLLADTKESESVRDHAAEALGHRADLTAKRLLEKVASESSSRAIRRSCRFALRQLASH